jgi:hypothetical protein
MINFRGEACNDDRIGGLRSRHTAIASGGEALLVWLLWMAVAFIGIWLEVLLREHG